MTISDLRTDLNIADTKDADLIVALKVRVNPAPVMDAPATSMSSGGLNDQYNISGHKVNDPILRKNRKVKVKNETSNETGHQAIGKAKKDYATVTELVTRISLALQKKIVESSVAFTFGNDVEVKYSPTGTNQDKANTALKRILHDNKSYSLDRKVGRNIFRATEVAEYWYTTDAPTGFSSYGFTTKKKVRCTLFSPVLGDQLFPYYDATGDMVAFSRQFTRTDGANKQTVYFETYTDEEKKVWTSQTGGTWTEEVKLGATYTIGKIPVVYGRQDEVEWADVQPMIEELETLLSNFGDINKRYARPKTIVKGKFEGIAAGGETDQVLQVENGGDVKYLEWMQASDSVKLEIETLLRLIHSLTQTPDISFDSVKGLSAISGVALQLLFMDAHLKVKNKDEIFIEYFQRRYSILQSFIGELNNGIKTEALSMQFEPSIKPFMINDEAALVTLLTTANGGNSIISQKTSIKLSGLVEDVDEEYQQIQNEEKARTLTSAFESVV